MGPEDEPLLLGGCTGEFLPLDERLGVGDDEGDDVEEAVELLLLDDLDFENGDQDSIFLLKQ